MVGHSDLILSSSSVEAYVSCHWRWYLNYVEADRGEQNIKAAVGLAVHAGVEHYYKGIIEGRLPAELENEARDVFDSTFLIEASTIADPEEDPRKMRAIGRRVTQSYIEDVARKTQPAMVEQAGIIAINGIDYSFHIDLVDTSDQVRDLKTKGSKPRDATRYLRALTGYALGFRSLTGRVERDLVIDVMVRLKRDRPYHVPLRYGGPVSSRDIGLFARQLEDTASGITRGDFAPTGLETGACRYCFVRSACVYYAEFTKVTGETLSATSNDDQD